MQPKFDSPEEDAGVGPIAIPTGPATESALGSLHGIVSEYLTLKLATGKATAAEVGAAITFLKNNSITASPEQNAALSKLSQTLRERRDRKGGLTRVAAAQATEDFNELLGGMNLGSMQ